MNDPVVPSITATAAHRPEIDGLRAISVASVLLFHAGLGVPGGYIGVDVFFAISGFLITRLILKDLDVGTFSIAEFWERRIRRIVPALAVTIGFVLVGGYFLLLPDQLAELGRSSLAQTLLLANVYFWRDTGYFAAPAEHKPLLHTWSLAVEEQFYLLFPLLLVVLNRAGRRLMQTTLAIIWIASFAASVYGAYRHPSASFFLLPTRAWELLAGCLVAFVPESMRIPRPVREGLALLGVASIVAGLFLFDKETLFPGFAAILPVGGAAAVLLANGTGTTWIGRVLAVSPLAYLGRISYSLYLWHWPILVYLKIAFGATEHWQLTLVAMTASLVAAAVSTRWIETPFRRRSASSRRARVFAWAGAGQALLIGASMLFWMTGGLPSRMLAVQKIVSDIEVSKLEYGSFVTELESRQVPTIGLKKSATGRIDFALFGDSHALAFAPLFDGVAQRHGLTGFVIASNGVSPFLLDSYDSSIDVRKRNRLFLQTLTRENIKDVCLVVRWDWQLEMAGVADAFCSLFGSMERAGVERVYLFRQVPCQPLGDAYAQQIVAAFRFPSLVSLPRMTADQYRLQAEKENILFDKLPAFETLEVEVVDTATLCFDQNGYSRVVESGRSLYRDDDHLSRNGAEVLLGGTVDSVLARIAERRGGG